MEPVQKPKLCWANALLHHRDLAGQLHRDCAKLALPLAWSVLSLCLTAKGQNRRNFRSRLVVVAQLVEPQIVVLVVAGSSPVDHPILFLPPFLCDQAL